MQRSLVSTNITFEALSVGECRELLASQDVGRVAFVGEDGFPAVLPVNYLIDGELIVFRTAPGAKYASIPERPVAFEVDRFERWNRGGWSVLVQGFGEDLTTATSPQYDALRRRSITTWAPGAKSHWLAIDVKQIAGRRISSIPEPTRSPFRTDDS
jgi:nitroimidazol reductase NimA-like FMN-containing flavoprotein (pyridoxamine 5'-phosphate oxidase superfamily)